MSPTFTENDVEKRVENAAGDVIGVVTAVEGDAVRVEPKPGVMDSVRSALGWGRVREDAVYVREDSVDEISNTVIRIEGEPIRSDAEAESTEEPSTGSSEGVDAGPTVPGDEVGSTTDDAAETTFDVGDADRTRERTELDTGDVETQNAEREPGLGPAPDEGVGRREREPGNVGESGEAPDTTADEAHELNAGADSGEADLVEEMNRGDEVDEEPVDPTEESGTREESGSMPVAEEAVEPEEMDLLEDREHGIRDDSVDDVGDVAEMDAVDESEIADDGASDRWDRQETAADSGGVDPAEELDPGVGAAAKSEADDRDADAGDEGSPRSAPDRIASEGDADRWSEADAGTMADDEASARPDAADREADAIERETDAAERGFAATKRGTDAWELGDERPDASGGSPVEAAIDAQRTAIAEGQRAVTRGLRIQHEMAHLAVETQTELGCRTFEQFGSVTRAYVDALSAMTGADANAGSAERTDDAQERIRELEAQLERQRDELEDVRERLMDRETE